MIVSGADMEWLRLDLAGYNVDCIATRHEMSRCPKQKPGREASATGPFQVASVIDGWTTALQITLLPNQKIYRSYYYLCFAMKHARLILHQLAKTDNFFLAFDQVFFCKRDASPNTYFLCMYIS